MPFRLSTAGWCAEQGQSTMMPVVTPTMDRDTSPILHRTAVLFLVFNRPDTTWEVFKAIRAARPPRLYVACDGPRGNKPGEVATVEALQRTIMDNINWPCTAYTLFRDTNLGCREAVSGAITWFFGHEEEGIILEDDCLPSPSFFPFCENLLEAYRNDERIAGITGDFRPVTSNRPSNAIGRVGYPLIWGWASWRRVWKNYDPSMSAWTGDPLDLPHLASKPRATRKYLKLAFDAVANGKLNTWDFQFNFLLQQTRQDFLHPHVNLITNIGFETGATHTSDAKDPNATLPRGEVTFPLDGPVAGRDYETWLERNVFVRSLATKAKKKLYRWLTRVLDRR
jgi:hypothetical protein